MKIDIIGRHPDPDPGFCGVMSLYEARHLSQLGHEVTLYRPFLDKSDLDQYLRRAHVGSLSELRRDNALFAIEPLFLDTPQLPTSDAIIWQSVDAHEWKALYSAARAATKVFTKNFGKFVPFTPLPVHIGVTHQFAAFDLVAFALKEDLQALAFDSQHYAKVKHRACHVPRGADPYLLRHDAKQCSPTIAIDTPNDGSMAAIEHLYEPIRRLRLEFPDLKVLALGRDITLEDVEVVHFRPHPEMCRAFLNPSWIYCVIDYGESVPLDGEIHSLDLNWNRRPVYEVQNIEAQMAGCVLFGHESNIVDELILPNKSCFTFSDFDDADDITNRLRHIICNFSALSSISRQWAENSFSWKDSIAKWEAGIAHLVENDYRRDARIAHAPSNRKLGDFLDQSRSILAVGQARSIDSALNSLAREIFLARLPSQPEISKQRRVGELREFMVEHGTDNFSNSDICGALRRLPIERLDLVMLGSDCTFDLLLEVSRRISPHTAFVVPRNMISGCPEGAHFFCIELEEDDQFLLRRSQAWGKTAVHNLAKHLREHKN